MGYTAFILLATLSVISALGVVVNRNPVRSAMCLVATLFVIALLFISLDAHLVGALQIVVYAGAIMVLFLFVIMLLNLQEVPIEPGRKGLRIAGSAAGAALLAVLIAGFVSAGTPGIENSEKLVDTFGTTVAVSERLFTHFLLPFEITSLLLLVAIVGAVVVAKKKLD